MVFIGLGFAMTNYQFRAYQRLIIDYSENSILQQNFTAQRSNPWLIENSNKIGLAVVRVLSQGEFMRRVSDEIFTTSKQLPQYIKQRSQFVLERVGLGVLAGQVSAPTSADIHGIVAAATSVSLEANGEIKISVQHLSPFVATEIANVAVVAAREFAMEAGLSEISDTAEYLEGQIAKLSEQIERSDKVVIERSFAEVDDGREKSITETSSAISRIQSDLSSNELELAVVRQMLGLAESEDELAEDRELFVDRQFSLISEWRLLKRKVQPFSSAQVKEIGESQESREARQRIAEIRSQLAERGIDLGDDAFLLVSDLSPEQLKTRMAFLVQYIKGAKRILSGLRKTERVLLDRQAGQNRSRLMQGVWFRSLDGLYAQIFNLNMTKIALQHKYRSAPPLSPGAATRSPPLRSVVVFFLLLGMGAIFALSIVRLVNNPPFFSSHEFGAMDLKLWGKISDHSLRDRIAVWRKGSIITPVALTQFKTLAARVVKYFDDSKGRQRTIAFTSTIPGEGKSFCALRTSIALARDSRKVLLIDLDLHMSHTENSIKGYVVKEGVKREPPLTGFNFSRLRHGFDILVPSNSKGLTYDHVLEQLKGKNKLELLLAQYDFIIFDLPPVSHVPDALKLFDLVQDVMYVVSLQMASKREVVEQLNIINDTYHIDSHLILNRADSQLEGYGYANTNYHVHQYDETQRMKAS